MCQIGHICYLYAGFSVNPQGGGWEKGKLLPQFFSKLFLETLLPGNMEVI